VFLAGAVGFYLNTLTTNLMWRQKEVILTSKPRGFHLVTSEIVGQITELNAYKFGLAHFFIQHTSASLAINENADPSVRHDMEAFFNHSVPENEPYYMHTLEGSDDMPAHLKSVIIGTDLTIPIAKGRLLLGTWQGIYLCEHRDYGGQRHLIVTLTGEKI
jgi:secondary thiamine-phosphate synthase enzyme